MTAVQQLWIAVGIPSLLVVLSWIHNNTRLSRLESGLDAVNRRMDDLQRSVHNDMLSFQAVMREEMLSFQRGMHNDMLTFQAALLNETSAIRERVAVVEVRR